MALSLTQLLFYIALSTDPIDQGFPTWGSRALKKGVAKTKNKFIFNIGRENCHKIPLNNEPNLKIIIMIMVKI